jgi:hypothetical protein
MGPQGDTLDTNATPGPPPAAPRWAGDVARVSVGTVLGRTMGLWRKHALPFVVAAFVLELPSTFFEYARVAAEARGAPRPFAGALPTSLAFLLLTAMLTAGALESLTGRPVRLSAMLSTGLNRFGRLLGVSLLTSVVIGLATVLLVVPGLMALSALWLAIPAAVAEPVGVLSSVQRSRELTKGHRWTIFLTFAILVGMNVGAAIALSAAAELAPFQSGAPAAAFAALAGTALAAVTSGLWATAPAVAFHDLRALKEGGDASALSRVFE